VKKPRSITNDFWQRVVEVFGTDSPTAISDEISKTYRVSQQAVSRWKAGQSLPSRDVLNAIQTTTGVVSRWLLTGEGEKFMKPGDAMSVEQQPLKPYVVLPQRSDRFIPKTTLELRARRASEAGEAMVPVLRDSVESADLRDYTMADVCELVITSTEFKRDGLLPGQRLLCVPCTPDNVRDGDQVIAEVDGEIVIRLYHRQPADIRFDHRIGAEAALFSDPAKVNLLYRVIG
jgi:transcriptional regulator with XRE-family HTH domain